MNETIEEKIERFKTYNRTMIAVAVSKPNLRHQGLPAKLLLCSIFDSLSIAAFPGENAGLRYKKTISDHSKWEHHDRVSLLQLCGVLNRAQNIPVSFDDLKSWSSNLLSTKFPSKNRLISRHVDIDRDPTLEQVLDHWPKKQGKHEKLNNLRPDDLTHRGLVWKYRNRLAHEFRLPGSGAQSPFRMEYKPYYQEVSTVTDIDPVNGLIFSNHWELIYPTGFFFDITKAVLDSICEQYRTELSSPFLQYDEGSLWV